KRAFDFLFAVLLTAFLAPALSVGASDASSDSSRGADIPNGAASVRAPAPPAEPTLFPAEPRAEEREKEPTKANLRPNRAGVQTYFPSVAKIICRSAPIQSETDGVLSIPYSYGTGSYVSEYRDWGVVLTNWHVVNEAPEEISVVFPDRAYRARVILHDPMWDLAALVIENPRGLTPLPISRQWPRLGETFWVGGYGPPHTLDEFKMSRGKLTTYVAVRKPSERLALEGEQGKPQGDADKPGASEEAKKAGEVEVVEKRAGDKGSEAAPADAADLLYETMSINVGVRQGDSGGPIFNSFGELAGIIWGSDGESTMGTCGPRMQVFLTQAMLEAANLRARDELRFANRSGASPFRRGVGSAREQAIAEIVGEEERAVPEAKRAEEKMDAALAAEGVLPISTRPVYMSPGAQLTAASFQSMSLLAAENAVKRAAQDRLLRSGGELPPSPPIFSTSFVVAQRNFGVERPELIAEDSFNDFEDYARSRLAMRLLAADADTKVVPQTAMERAATSSTNLDVQLAPVSYSPHLDGGESAQSASESELAQETAPPEGEPTARGAAEETADSRTVPAVPFGSGGNLSDIKAYMLIIAVVFLFCISIRFLQPDSEPVPRGKREKSNLRQVD
ncbi:MAG: serine protease, partial [Thermoguttaceae bacterium]